MQDVTTPSEQPSWAVQAAKQGGILGIVGILITLLIYLVHPAFFASFWLLLLFLVLDVTLASVFTIKYRNETGGFISFKNAFLYGAVLILVAMIISRVFTIVLFNVIDTELSQFVTDTTVENMTTMMKGWNTPESKIDEAVDNMRKEMPAGFTTIGILKGIAWPGFLIVAIVACISGLISKKKVPEATL